MLSGELFSEGDQYIKLNCVKRHRSLRRALISNNCHLCYKKELWVGKNTERGEGKKVILSNSTSTQIPNHKTSKKKKKRKKERKKEKKRKNDMSKQHSKQAIRQGKLRKITKCLLTRFS